MSAPTGSTSPSTSQVEPTPQEPQRVSVTGNGSEVTEDEAALYDRQIRLWGLAAQSRLRSAHILIVGWDGIATEVIKNTVLSGIGSITVLDPTTIDASVDLLSGFFFRDEEVGLPKCSQGPLDRIRALNPLVKVYGVSDGQSYETLVKGGEDARAWLKEQGVDVVVAGTSLPATAGVGLKEQLVTLNDTARAVGIKFFLSAILGFGGFYFADQITHDYLIERPGLPPNPSSSTTETPAGPQRVKRRQAFVPLSTSLSTTWTDLTSRQQRRLRIPLDWFVWLSLIDLGSRLAPNTTISVQALKDRTSDMIREKGLDVDTVLKQADAHVFESTIAPASTGVALAPVASVVGGVLSQDILNSIGGREEPVVNWLFMNMDASGATNVYRIGHELTNPVVVD